MSAKWIAPIVVGVGLAGLAARRAATPSEPPANITVLYDRSGSTTGGCEALVGAVSESIATTRLSRHSTVSVLATGDRATVGEPTELSTMVELTSTRSIEGPHAAARKRAAALAALAERCAALPTATTSPIALGVRRAVEGLRARSCGSRSGCRIVVVSDLQENVDGALAARLRSRRSASPLATIDNAGIPILFRGYACTRGPADGARRGHVRAAIDPERPIEAWRSAFAAPQLVSFDPRCAPVVPLTVGAR